MQEALSIPRDTRQPISTRQQVGGEGPPDLRGANGLEPEDLVERVHLEPLGNVCHRECVISRNVQDRIVPDGIAQLDDCPQ